MTKRPPSLLFRITVRLTLITIASIVLSSGWVYYQLKYGIDRVSEGDLLSQAEDIQAQVKLVNGGLAFSLPPDLIDKTDEGQGLFRYSVRNANGDILFGSAYETAPSSKIRLIGHHDSIYQTRHQVFGYKAASAPEKFFGVMLRQRVGDRTVTVQVERFGRQTETLMDTFITEFFVHGAWIAVPFLLFLLLISFLTIRGAVAPLRELARQAARIGPASPDVRLAESGVHREILPLVQSMNHALDRLESGFRMQREFTADAAHELRTPLAVLCAHIDTLSDRELARSLRQDADRMTRIVSQLLKVAQLESLTIDPAETADLNDVAVAVATFMIPVAVNNGKTIETNCSTHPALVYGSYEIIFNALRNLVENGLHHAGSRSAVEIAVEGGTLSVIDHGDGIPHEQHANLFKRFWRMNRSGDGAGLGLAIVKRTMDLHRGSVTVTPTPGGGTTFVLRFRVAGRSLDKNAPEGAGSTDVRNAAE